MNVTRRDFFIGAAAAATVPGVTKAMQADGGKDQSLSIFMSDIHVASSDVKTKAGAQPDYQNPLFEKVVDEVLTMRPLPSRVVVFGDVALWSGWHQDYEKSLPAFNRLKAAGIDVFVTTGNHDYREPMFRCHPHQAEITPVPGRFVSVINLGSADLFLMDSLKENPKGEGSGNAVDGALDEAQQTWLRNAANAAKRPFFVGAHHDPDEVRIGNEKLTVALEGNPLFVGYICGHHHRFYRKWYHDGYLKRHVTRLVCLPSTGWWGDIGYAIMRTYPNRAELSLVENDFFFPSPLKPGERRPPEWDDIIAENKGAVSVFRY